MILGIALFLWFIWQDQPEGQAFRGSRYARDPNRRYSHRQKRKKFADGKYHYFDG